MRGRPCTLRCSKWDWCVCACCVCLPSMHTNHNIQCIVELCYDYTQQTCEEVRAQVADSATIVIACSGTRCSERITFVGFGTHTKTHTHAQTKPARPGVLVLHFGTRASCANYINTRGSMRAGLSPRRRLYNQCSGSAWRVAGSVGCACARVAGPNNQID